MPKNVKYLNHPKTMPPPPARSMEKLSSKKLVPGAKKVGDHCYRNYHMNRQLIQPVPPPYPDTRHTLCSLVMTSDAGFPGKDPLSHH